MTLKLTKQMLCISVQDPDSNPYLRFEIEPYYRRQTRPIFTEESLYTFDVDELKKDEEFIEDIGFWIVLGLLIQKKLAHKKGFYLNHLVYPHHRGANPVLRIDKEPYEFKPYRRYCGDLPLSTVDVDIAAGDTELKSKVAKTVLEFLPLHGWEEVQELA